MRLVRSAFPEAMLEIAPSRYSSGLRDVLSSMPATTSIRITENTHPRVILSESLFVSARISLSSIEIANPQFVPLMPRYATSLLELPSFTQAWPVFPAAISLAHALKSSFTSSDVTKFSSITLEASLCAMTVPSLESMKAYPVFPTRTSFTMSLMFSNVTFAQKKPIVLPLCLTAREKWTTALPVAREITGLSMSLS